jgi:membrane-bound lytic murein transglycosylase F
MARYIILSLLCIGLVGCQRQPTLLDQVKADGELVVVTRNSPTTYFEGPDGPTGFEYDLASLFAESLGVKIRLIVPRTLNDVLRMVADGEAHMAAAGLTITDQRRHLVRFTPSYQEITPQLVYRLGTRTPRSLADLHDHLEVVAGSSHAERLQELKKEFPDLTWQENDQLESEELLYLVWEEVIDYTIADSNEVALNRGFYPELRVAFDISPPEPLAWAFPRGRDSTLFRNASAFISKLREDGTLEQLVERYYGHVQDFDYVGTRAYKAHIEQRLPLYRPMFVVAGEQSNTDWRLLAAMGYQESHWNPRAVSPTGVRGIMMLTRDAMEELGISNRADPEQSIRGGATYFAAIRQKLPERIPEPDRTWLALAAYNVGLGHLDDARKLTEENGGNPDNWVDVKKSLPLLSQKRWHEKLRHGYARGREPVRYVENVRTYYHILVWLTDQENADPEINRALSIESPVL